MKAELSSLGSFKLDSTVLDIKNIPTTENYYILTENEVIIVYLFSRELNKKSQLTVRSFSRISQESLVNSVEVYAELHKITEVQNGHELVVNVEYAPYDQFALLSRPGKSTIWTRKCLKRNQNPIDELVNVHDLNYYLIDSASRNNNQTTVVKFISQNEYLWGLLE